MAASIEPSIIGYKILGKKMTKLLITICLVAATALVLTGCEFDAGTYLSKLGTHDAETNVDIPKD